MTPAIDRAREAGIEFTVHELPGEVPERGYGLHAARAMGVPPDRVLKTLVANLDDGRRVVAIVPVAGELDLKRLAALAGAKRAALAPAADAERFTGYVRGGISPLGQRRPLEAYLDETALRFPTVFVSAGRRGLELELAPSALRDACAARVGDLVRTR